jgi:transcriptional regulator with XRE-family HTH domain
MTRLRVLREERLLTQKDLAVKTGLTVATISRLENGQRRPRFTTLRKLAEALGVTPQVLVNGDGR